MAKDIKIMFMTSYNLEICALFTWLRVVEFSENFNLCTTGAGIMTIMRFIYQIIIIALLIDPKNTGVNPNIKSLVALQIHIQTHRRR